VPRGFFRVFPLPLLFFPKSFFASLLPSLHAAQTLSLAAERAPVDLVFLFLPPPYPVAPKRDLIFLSFPHSFFSSTLFDNFFVDGYLQSIYPFFVDFLHCRRTNSVPGCSFMIFNLDFPRTDTLPSPRMSLSPLCLFFVLNTETGAPQIIRFLKGQKNASPRDFFFPYSFLSGVSPW